MSWRFLIPPFFSDFQVVPPALDNILLQYVVRRIPSMWLVHVHLIQQLLVLFPGHLFFLTLYLSVYLSPTRRLIPVRARRLKWISNGVRVVTFVGVVFLRRRELISQTSFVSESKYDVNPPIMRLLERRKGLTWNQCRYVI